MAIVITDQATHIEFEFTGDEADERYTLPYGEISLKLGSDAVYVTAGKEPGNGRKSIELRLTADKVTTPSVATNALLYDAIQTMLLT
jgi:hypothetical protein